MAGKPSSSKGKLTAEELPAFKVYMDRFDASSDGKINCSELGTMIKALHRNSPGVSDEQLEALLAEADADANGSLDFSEFMRAYGSVLKRRLADKNSTFAIYDAFFTFDKDNNATISADELGQLMKVLGENMTAEEIADINKDGLFKLTEFKKLMENKYWK